jgi:Tfp pilus assembly protein PilX
MKKRLMNENGSVLLISMLVLVLLTLLGIVALDTTDIELRVTTNDRTYKEAFHAADGAGMAAVKVVRNSLDSSEGLTLPSISYAESAADFYGELTGTAASDDAVDLSFNVSDTTQVGVDVQLINVVSIAGGGTEFAAGYSSSSTSGSTGMRYAVETEATAPNNSTSTVYLEYLKVLNTPGGL